MDTIKKEEVLQEEEGRREIERVLDSSASTTIYILFHLMSYHEKVWFQICSPMSQMLLENETESQRDLIMCSKPSFAQSGPMQASHHLLPTNL